MEQPKPFDVHLKNPTHVVIEMFGGDNNLSPFVNEDMEEARRGNQGPFAMLAIADREHRTAEVVEISEGRRRRLESLGEIDTGDPVVLRNFLARALVTYQAAPHVAIGFWDHGSGVFDEHDDDELILRRRPLHSRAARTLFRPRVSKMGWGVRAMLHDDTGGLLTTREAAAMLTSAFEAAGRADPVDVVFSDTCLNGMLEVAHELGARATVVVGSEELEPGDGWDYFGLFRRMTEVPPVDASSWAGQMVDSFHDGYVHRPDQQPCTLAAFATANEMVPRFGTLVAALKTGGKAAYREALEARMSTQSFTGAERYDTFDLEHFGRTLADLTESDAVKEAAIALAQAVATARIAETHLGDSVANAKGIAFWFPSSGSSFRKDRDTYRALSCAAQMGWVDYLGAMIG